MATITEKVHLILAEIGENHNKQWSGILYDNGDVETRWGRVGLGEQSKMFPRAGKSFLDKKEKEKLKKGYTPLRTISGDVPNVVTPAKSDLHQIALEQIKTTSPELTKLIKRLVEANIHKITANTNVTFNQSTGLFTTPLGVVTLDGITDARQILADCVGLVTNKDWQSVVPKINQYLRIVPQNIGMRRLEASTFLPNLDAIQKQNDILDSLEASYQAMQAPTATPVQTKKALEQVFNVRLDVLNDSKERERLEKKFYSTRKSMHNYNHIKVVAVYEVDIESMTKAFNAKVGNIQEVYHGTGMANCLSILKSGIKCAPPSSAAIAGKLFGNGTYGSQTSSKSLGYTLNRWGQGGVGDAGFLFVCDFAMGKAFYPTSYGIHGVPREYHSCWALPEKTGLHNDELIVYHDSDVKIKYLLEVK